MKHILALSLAALVMCGCTQPDTEKAKPCPCPDTKPCPCPGPCPCPKPDTAPKRPLRPKGAEVEEAGKLTLGGPIAPDGKTEIQVDLPVDQRIENIGSELGNHAGMCVFSSCEMSMRWANLEQWRGWRNWCAHNYPGGGHPQKVTALLEAYAKEKGIPIPPYVQFEGKDLSLIKAALKSGRLPAVTYNGHDPHYSGTIAHMVNCPHCDEQYACILDNNFIGEGELVWQGPGDFQQRYAGDGGWCVVFLSPGPPPPPRN